MTPFSTNESARTDSYNHLSNYTKMEYPTSHLYILYISIGNKGAKVECNTVVYTTASLYSDWLYIFHSVV